MIDEVRIYTTECATCGEIIIGETRTHAEFLLEQHIKIKH